MENINIKVESKFWEKINKWAVAVYLPSERWECWHECCFHKNRDRAEKNVMELLKKHIDFVREMEKSAEKREEVLTY